jgi:hypothetical protein
VLSANSVEPAVNRSVDTKAICWSAGAPKENKLSLDDRIAVGPRAGICGLSRLLAGHEFSEFV